LDIFIRTGNFIQSDKVTNLCGFHFKELFEGSRNLRNKNVGHQSASHKEFKGLTKIINALKNKQYKNLLIYSLIFNAIILIALIFTFQALAATF